MDRRLVITLLVIAAACFAGLKVWQRDDASRRPRPDPLASEARSASPLLPRVRLSPDERPPLEPSPRRRPPTASSSSVVDTPPAEAPKPGGQTRDRSLERLALAHVGADSLAEAIWLDAINDPFLTAQDRSDLIEDLNEDGFADPRNLTPNDIPLIAGRLALIEREAPFAMDQTNATAFAEAHKDLVEMYERATSAAASAAVAGAAAAAEAAAAEAASAEAASQAPSNGPAPATPPQAGE